MDSNHLVPQKVLGALYVGFRSHRLFRQGRYVLRHPYTEPAACDVGVSYRSGLPRTYPGAETR